jgi:hypothetical protein
MKLVRDETNLDKYLCRNYSYRSFSADLMHNMSSGYFFLGISNNRIYWSDKQAEVAQQVPLHEAARRFILLTNERIEMGRACSTNGGDEECI